MVLSTEEAIIKGIEEIRPYLQRDGGDIQFVELTDDNVVKVQLRGACHGCAGAQLTIKCVVERVLKEAVPEIKGVETVDPMEC